ncbi:MAG: hypothetical protein ABH828_01335 [archaeon]
MKFISLLLVFVFVLSLNALSVNAWTGTCDNGCDCWDNTRCRLTPPVGSSCFEAPGEDCDSGYVCSGNACVADTTIPDEHDLTASSRNIDDTFVTLVMTSDDNGDGLGIEYYTLHRKERPIGGSWSAYVHLAYNSISGSWYWTSGTPSAYSATGNAVDNYRTTYTDNTLVLEKEYYYDAHVYDWAGNYDNSGNGLYIDCTLGCDDYSTQCTKAVCGSGTWLSSSPSSIWQTGTYANCCGDDNEVWNREKVLSRSCYSLASPYGCSSGQSTDKVCIQGSDDGANSCVFNSVYYENNGYADSEGESNPNTADGHDERIICVGVDVNGHWADCDHADWTCKASCSSTNDADWIVAGESGVGEYTDTTTSKCCGDDGSEYVISAGVGPTKCCSSSSECVDNDGDCQSGTAETNANGNCGNGVDDDCDGDIDSADSDCCGGEGAACTTDAQCCGSIPCDNPIENNGNTCGCPTGYDWVPDAISPGVGDCVPLGASCGVPPSNCDVNPIQVGCLYTITPSWNPTQGCCEYGIYGGTTDYAWDDIITY